MTENESIQNPAKDSFASFQPVSSAGIILEGLVAFFSSFSSTFLAVVTAASFGALVIKAFTVIPLYIFKSFNRDTVFLQNIIFTAVGAVPAAVATAWLSEAFMALLIIDKARKRRTGFVWTGARLLAGSWYLLTSLLCELLIILTVLPLLLFGVYAANIVSETFSRVSGPALVTLSYFIWLGPAALWSMWLLANLSFVPMVAAVEKRGWFNALRQSRLLVKISFTRVLLLRALTFAGGYYIIFSAMKLPVYLRLPTFQGFSSFSISTLSSLSLSEIALCVAVVIKKRIPHLFFILVNGWMAASMALLYVDHRSRRERQLSQLDTVLVSGGKP